MIVQTTLSSFVGNPANDLKISICCVHGKLRHQPVGTAAGITRFGQPGTNLPRFIGGAALSPWIHASITLQILSYVMWMLIVSREKLGVATATVGAGFYTLMALSAWLVYGETLSPVQWTGIALVTLGVIFISLGGVTP
jgi:drug/metabolite transporter (DMT)-like permease